MFEKKLREHISRNELKLFLCPHEFCQPKLLPLDQQYCRSLGFKQKTLCNPAIIILWERETPYSKIGKKALIHSGKRLTWMKILKGWERYNAFFLCVDQISVSLFCSLLHTDVAVWRVSNEPCSLSLQLLLQFIYQEKHSSNNVVARQRQSRILSRLFFSGIKGWQHYNGLYNGK